MTIGWKRNSLIILGVIAFLIFILWLMNFIFPLQYSIKYSTIVTTHDGTVAHAYLSSDDKWRMKSEVQEVSVALKKIIVAKEDKYFYHHFGVNPVAILRAFFNNFFHHKKTSGASTITMQVARLLEPKKRTYSNKLIEIFRALQLEWMFSKKEILQLYLNLVPYGGNIEGVKSASVLYFQKLPDHLSIAQAVVLSIVPNRPTSLALYASRDKLLAARNKWLMRLKGEHLFTEQEIQDALNEPLTLDRQPSPKNIPHLALWLKNKYVDEPIIQSNIHLPIQHYIEQIVKNYSHYTANRNIFNASVLVIDNIKHEVICYVGSQDFADNMHSGQVDGVQALRSPGSTLKPFVYGLGFDKGLATPKTIITDVPTDFDGYAPENFDKKFNGKVSVEQALSYSLNIPAVKMLEMVGKNNFISLLSKGNFKSVKKRQQYLGLSMILGGCSVTLEELTTMYSALANDGKYYPLKYLKQDKIENNSVSILSPAAVFMVSNILSATSRPDLPQSAENNTHIPKIAWKTGTSYGRRDAWCIGYNSRYTVGVWLGNFSGRGAPELTGADIATPLLFSIFNYIDYNSNAAALEAPVSVGVRFVCKETGKLAEEDCEKPVIDFYIPKISNSEKCNHQKWVWLSPDENMSYCPECLPIGGYKKKKFPNLPSELLNYYEQQQIPFLKIPTHNPRCKKVLEESSLRIISPAHDKQIFIDKDEPAEIMLKCYARNDVIKVYWYINDVFFKEARATESIFFKPTRGETKISCSDDKGNATSVAIRIDYE